MSESATWTREQARAYATACGVTPPRPTEDERDYVAAVRGATTCDGCGKARKPYRTEIVLAYGEVDDTLRCCALCVKEAGALDA